MAFMDNMKGRLSKASQTTVQKAKDLSAVARLNTGIADMENQINELYKKIGYEIYSAYHDHPLPEAEEWIRKVTELHQSIEDCKAQIKEINAANSCPSCGARIKPGMAFCSNCGCKLPAAEQPSVVQEQVLYCSNCGAPYTPGAVFCTSCGKRIE